MPYINQDIRKIIDPIINQFVKDCSFETNNPIWEEKFNGIMNYIVTQIILNLYQRKYQKWSYEILSDVIKTLECSKLEIYRRLLSEYENSAANKNGDLEILNI